MIGLARGTLPVVVNFCENAMHVCAGLATLSTQPVIEADLFASPLSHLAR
jgi:hypothetical protein